MTHRKGIILAGHLHPLANCWIPPASLPPSPEEIAFGQGWINAAQIQKLAAPLAKNGYGQYLLGLVK